MTHPLRQTPVVRSSTSLARTLVNGVALLGANLVTSAAQYAIVVLVARALGPETFGTYLFALTYAAFFATVCNFGLDRILIRDIVRRPETASSSLAAAAAVRAVLAIVCFALAMLVASAFGYATDLRVAIALLLASQVFALFSELFRSVLYAAGAMPHEARLRALGRFVAVALVAMVLLAHGGLIAVAAALAAAAFVEVAMYTVGASRRIALRRVPVERAIARGLVRDAWPIALNTVLVVLYFRVNIVMLTSWKGAAAAGLFGAAFTFLQVLQVVSGSLAGILLPSLTDRLLDGEARVRDAVQATTYYVLLFVLPVSVGLSLMAPDLVGIVYGPRYDGAVPALWVLAWANVFMFLGSLYGTLLIVLDAERFLVWVSAAALVVSVTTNCMFVPALGAVGAAWSSVTTEMTVAAATFWLARRRLGPIVPAGLVVKPALAAIVVAVVLVAADRRGALFRGAAGLLAFAASVAALRAVPFDGALVTPRRRSSDGSRSDGSCGERGSGNA